MLGLNKSIGNLSSTQIKMVYNSWAKDQTKYRGLKLTDETKKKLEELGVTKYVDHHKTRLYSSTAWDDYTEAQYGTRGYTGVQFLLDRKLGLFPVPPASCMLSVFLFVFCCHCQLFFFFVCVV